MNVLSMQEMIYFRLRKRVRFVMPGRPLSEMERPEDERDETDDDHLRQVQVCNQPEEEIQNDRIERARLIPDTDNK